METKTRRSINSSYLSMSCDHSPGFVATGGGGGGGGNVSGSGGGNGTVVVAVLLAWFEIMSELVERGDADVLDEFDDDVVFGWSAFICILSRRRR
jgi:hypothetical protein